MSEAAKTMSETNKIGVIRDINGPIVTIELPGARSGEQVKIGELGLYGEIISLSGERAVVQTYESTDGVRPGEPAVGLGWAAVGRTRAWTAGRHLRWGAASRC
jgi:Archaeal/vacuolar-type H+-ATPase subunit A